MKCEYNSNYSMPFKINFKNFSIIFKLLDFNFLFNFYKNCLYRKGYNHGHIFYGWTVLLKNIQKHVFVM